MPVNRAISLVLSSSIFLFQKNYRPWFWNKCTPAVTIIPVFCFCYFFCFFGVIVVLTALPFYGTIYQTASPPFLTQQCITGTRKRILAS